MGTYTRDDATTNIYRLLRDTGDTETEQLLTDAEIDVALDLAVARYSRVRPARLVEDVAADGTTSTALPDGWIDEVSDVIAVESPVDDDPPSIIDSRLYRLYQAPDGWSLRWLPQYAPADGDTVRITYTGARTLADVAASTTVLDVDFTPLCALAASYGAESIAAHYARQHEPFLNADATVRTQAMDWQAIAKRFREIWMRHESSIASSPSGRVNWDMRQSAGVPWLTHRGLSR